MGPVRGQLQLRVHTRAKAVKLQHLPQRRLTVQLASAYKSEEARANENKTN